MKFRVNDQYTCFVIVIIFLLSCFKVIGQHVQSPKVNVVTPNTYSVNLSKNIEFIDHSEREIRMMSGTDFDTLKIISSLDSNTEWKDAWLRIVLKNEDDSYFQSYLKIGSELESAALFELEDDSLLQVGVTHRSIPAKLNYFLTTDQIIPVALRPGKSQIFFLKVSFSGTPVEVFRNSIHLIRAKTIINKQIRDNGLKMFFDGLMLLLGIISIIAFFVFRDRIFIYYLGLIILLSQITSLKGGLLPSFLPDFSNFISNSLHQPSLYYASIILFSFLFTTEQIKLKKYWHSVYRIFLILTAWIVLIAGIQLILGQIIRGEGFTRMLWKASVLMWVLIALTGIFQGVLRRRTDAIILFAGIILVSYIPLKHFIRNQYFNLTQAEPGTKHFSVSFLKWSPFNTDTNSSVLTFLIVFSCILMISLFRRINEIQRNRLNIRIEKERSEALLYNILPESVATELKNKGESEAKLIDQVTVLFTDFKEFTEKSEQLSPTELINELNVCFKAFDDITQKYNIEKIKTIGDAYMAAGGLYSDDEKSAAIYMVRAAMEMNNFMQARKEQCIANDQPYFEMRVGMHTGPIVAGVVGVKKFQYDIWGDTVNIASRMETNGKVGEINISDDTYNLVKSFEGFSFKSRGEIEVKGKGAIRMWFVSQL